MPILQPAYIEAFKSGALDARVEAARQKLKNCRLCPRKCAVDRENGETGICKTGRNAIVASYSPHFGEEAPLVGTRGSGTIFFTHCSLGCFFCQNYDSSHEGYGVEVTHAHLARIMLNLQDMGCHNINLVTPSHVVPQILAAVRLAVKNGLEIPLVYNSSGYDDVETLKMLDGIIDIYMPDFKFWDPDVAEESCRAPDYPEIAKKAIREMYRQVGDLHIVSGRAVRGLLIRHLVLPSDLAGTDSIVKFISSEISPHTYVNIMAQYHACGIAIDSEIWGSKITEKDYRKALESARAAGLTRLD